MKKHIYVNKNEIINYIVCLFFLTPFLQPNGMLEGFEILGGIYHYINSLFRYWRFGAIFVLILMFFLKKIYPSKFSICVLIFYAYMTFVCFYKDVSKDDAMNNLIYVMGIILIMDVFFEHSKIYMHILEYVIGVIIFLNVITVFLFPDGMYANIRGDEGNWILGYYNVHIFIILPWLIIFFICSIKRNGKLKWSAILVGVI